MPDKGILPRDDGGFLMGELTVGIGLQDDGLSQLGGLLWRLGDLSPALTRVGEQVVASVRENFAAQGRPEPWRPLSPETVRRKGNGTILVDTGRLISSISFETGRDYSRVTAGAPYAGFVQEAGRRFMLLQDEDIPAVTGLIESYLTNG
jgi:phage gpG-like protein